MTERLVESPSALQLGLETSGDTFGRLAPKLARIPRLGRSETPDDWLPWVLVDKGLEAIVPYVRDLPKALREGPTWLRIRGTDPAIEIGIGWVESTGTVAEADGIHPWYQFQVAFDAPPDTIDQARQLTGIINLSKSSWDDLFRLYSAGHDHRPVRADSGRFDDQLFDGYSGTALWDGGPLISFGWSASVVIDVGSRLAGVDEITEGGIVVRDEGLRFDVDRFEGRSPAILSVGIDIEGGARVDAFARDHWPNHWPSSWAEGAQPRVFGSAWETT